MKLYKILLLLLFVPFIINGGDESDEGCNCGEERSDVARATDNLATYANHYFERVVPRMNCDEVEKSTISREECLKRYNLNRGDIYLKEKADFYVVCQCIPPAHHKEYAKKRQLRLVQTVQVRRGWNTNLYVKKYRRKGASLHATALCNRWGWPLRKNPVLHPGQRLKICGWM